MEKPERILLIRLSAYGDIIHTVPMLNCIKTNFPNIPVDWAVSSRFENILSRFEGIDKIISLKSNAGDLKNNINLIKCEKYSHVFDVQGLLKSSVVLFLSRGKNKTGFDSSNSREMSSFFYKNKIDTSAFDHVVEKNCSLLRNIIENPVPICKEFKFSESEIEFSNKFLSENRLKNGEFIVLNYPAGWQSKMWSSAFYSELSEMIYRKLNYPVVLSYGPKEEMGAKLIQSMSEVPVLCFPKKTSVFETMSIISKARILVSGDTGHMHFADYLRIPVVGLFGPTLSERNGPYWGDFRILKGKPCGEKCLRKKCTASKCINSIKPESVFDKILSILKIN